MDSRAHSNVVYALTILMLALFAALGTFLPMGDVVDLADAELPASRPVLALVNGSVMLIIYGGLGFLGLHLARRLGFADVWDPEIPTWERLAYPALLGLGLGVFFIAADLLFSQLHGLGPLPHPPFPTSIVASIVAGIGEEVIFRLFFIPFWMWLISSLLLGGRGKETVFVVVTGLSAVAFALAHLPSVMVLINAKSMAQIPAALLAEILLLNSMLSVVAASELRRNGFLAAVSIHLWADVAWHVVWGMIG